MSTFDSRLLQQFAFIKEIDQLKGVLRQSLIMDGSRRENSAEHSWHFALAAMVLQEYSSKTINITTVLKMALIHDVVEVYAGDCFVYDEIARAEKAQKEQEAAEKIYSLLPHDMGKELHHLWLEYEAQDSAEAKFAQAIDRIIPLLCNLETDGHSWKKHGIKKQTVLDKNKEWRDAAPELHDLVVHWVEQAEKDGLL